MHDFGFHSDAGLQDLDNMNKNLVDWYSSYLIGRKDKIQSISSTVVADAFLDLTRCKEYEVNKGKLYGLRVYAKALKRYVSLAIWYPMDGEQTSGNFISLQKIPWMDARCWIITEPDSNWDFALEMASSMQESPTVSQPTSESWIFTSMRRLQPSTWPKRYVRGSE